MKFSALNADLAVYVQIGEIYAKIFLAVHIFFSETHLQVRRFGGFLRVMAQTTQFHERMCSLGVKNSKLIFNVFVLKISKNTMEPMGKIKQLFKRS